MIIAAVTDVSGVRHVHDPVHKSQCATVFLHQGDEDYSVVASRGVQIHRPAGICSARVHVQRINEMLHGEPAINASKKSDRDARSTTGVPDGANRIEYFRREDLRSRAAEFVALPDHAPGRRVERINIIRCGNSNDHRAVRPALDVKRLRMNVADDRAIKV